MRHEDLQFGESRSLRLLLDQQEDSFPLIVEIHPTDICNHRCSYCFHGGEGFDSSKLPWLLQLSDYERLLDELSRLGIEELSISGGGEPFADLRTSKLIDYAHRNNIRTRIVTNGNLLNQDDLLTLIHSSEIRFSIDSTDGEVYSKLRTVSPDLLQDTLHNISELVNLRSKHSTNLEIGATILLNELTLGNISKTIDDLLNIGVDKVVVKPNIYDTEDYFGLFEQLESFGSQVELRNPVLIDPQDKPCFIPHFKIALNPYGDVYSCCLGSQPGESNGFILGNIRSKTLEEVWFSSKELRNSMYRGVECLDCNHSDYLINQEIIND